MTSHAIENGRPVCLEPETAVCRAEWQCDCENLNDLERDPEGWTHTAYSGWLDLDVRHHSVGVYSATNCNICQWLVEDLAGGWVNENGWLVYFDEIPNGLIKIEWDYDYYVWDFIEPKVIGAVIGRLQVAKWANSLGLDYTEVAA